MVIIKYRIASEDLASGKITRGDPKYTKDEAGEIARRNNKEDPHNFYWVEPVSMGEEEE